MTLQRKCKITIVVIYLQNLQKQSKKTIKNTPNNATKCVCIMKKQGQKCHENLFYNLK